MKYLKEESYYQDLYDLGTIKKALAGTNWHLMSEGMSY
jgi:hypothetical protein